MGRLDQRSLANQESLDSLSTSFLLNSLQHFKSSIGMATLNVMYGSNINGASFILSGIAFAQRCGECAIGTTGSTPRQCCATVRTTGGTPQQGKHAFSFCGTLGSAVLVQGLGTDVQCKFVGT